MPNWCYNDIEVSGKKSEVLRLVEDMIGKPQVIYSTSLNLSSESDYEMLGELKALGEEKQECVTYSKILPQPDSVLLGIESWYEWRCNNWGVKWDIGDLSVSCLRDAVDNPVDGSEEHFCITFGYETPWGPPKEFFTYATLKYDISITMLSEEPGVMLYQKMVIVNGNCNYTLDTENELIFHYGSEYTVEDTLHYYLEPFRKEIASDNYEDEYYYIKESIDEFCNYIVDNGVMIKEEFYETLKLVVLSLEKDEKIANLILSRLLVELQEKVAVSN